MGKKISRPLSFAEAIQSRLLLLGRTVSVGCFTGAVFITTHTLFPAIRTFIRRQIKRKGTVCLESVPGPNPRPWPEPLTLEADIRPGESRRLKPSHLLAEKFPAPTYPFNYRRPPPSGNTINGRDELVPRRADHVFFGDNYRRAWGKLDWYFQVMEPTNIHRVITRIFWQDRNRIGPVARADTSPKNDVKTTELVKKIAINSGAALVGITHLTDNLRYKDFDLPFRYAIALAVPMPRDELLHVPSNRSCLAIMETYHDVNRVAVTLASAIRALGWPAHASTNISPDASEVLHVPTAIAAGLGELGKHGFLITVEHGANVRLATVLTDLPLVVDQPQISGIDDFCLKCRICELSCPPQAIGPKKYSVRGVERWSVDFDRCVPYFAENHSCGICIEACPWSEPGQGLRLAEANKKRTSSTKMTTE